MTRIEAPLLARPSTAEPPRSLLGIMALLLVVALASLGRAELTAEGANWAIASGHPEATEAGSLVLRNGGNVVDAAVAASLVLGVAEPYGSGLGGKLVMLHHHGESGATTCIEALCASPSSTDPDRFAALASRKRTYGYNAVCVPGLPAGLKAAHERWGSKPWSELVEPAVRLAQRGIIVSETMNRLWSPHEGDLKADPEAKRLYLLEGKTPPVGSRLPNPDLAATLQRLAAEGADEFYRGQTAERIVAAAQANGSPLTADDFRNYRARVVDPLAINYRGYRVYASPPPLTGGVTVLAVLKAQASLDWPRQRPRDAGYIDRVGRSLQVFYPQITRKIADTASARAHADEILSDASIKRALTRAASLDPAKPDSAPLEPVQETAASAGTSHLVVADSKGNMVSLTQSLSLHFGAAVVAPGTGLLLNNSMSNFATVSTSSPNFIAGGKRPRSTVTPIIATRDGLPTLALGIPGGQRIPTTTAQLLIDILGSNTPIDVAFERPRFHLKRVSSRRLAKNQIDLEHRDPPARLESITKDLQRRGWQCRTKPRNGLYFGGGNAIQYLPGGRLIAVADSRRTNHAAAN